MLNYEDGNLHNLHYGLIHSGLPTLIDLKRDTLPFVNDTAKPKNYTLCKEGDIAFADASEDTNDVAKAIEFINLEGQLVISGLHTIHGRDNGNKTVVGFKGYAFASSSFHNQIRRIAQGTKIYSISSKSFDEVFISIPNKTEQTKIARLLHLIDERITTQNKIIEDLQSLIKGLRERFFNCSYSSYISLGELAELYQPKTISTSDLEETGYLVYGANGIIGHYHAYNHELPQICITCRGNTCGQVTLTVPKSWITGNAMVVNIDGNKDINQSFLFHFLSSYNYSSIISGSGQPQIVRSPLAKIKVPNLDLKDQNKISRILDSVTSKVELEQNILSHLELQKKHLVNLMFI